MDPRIPTVVDLHVAELRKHGYANINEWLTATTDGRSHIYIGRNMRIGLGKGEWAHLPKSKWHNPFKGERLDIVAKFEEYARQTFDKASLEELTGAVLGCWCHPKSCHGHILVKLYKEIVLEDTPTPSVSSTTVSTTSTYTPPSIPSSTSTVPTVSTTSVVPIPAQFTVSFKATSTSPGIAFHKLVPIYIYPAIYSGADQLYVSNDIISEKLEQDLITFFNTQTWSRAGSGAKSRRVIHYGRKYDYQRRSDGGPTVAIPPILRNIADHLTRQGIMGNVDQIIINEYTPGQGIGAHTDIKSYGDVIISIAIGEDTNFIFRGLGEHAETIIYATHVRRALMVFGGIYRHKFTHEIPARKTVNYPSGERKTKLHNRISLTMRTFNS